MMMNYLKLGVVLISILIFSNCNIPIKDELQLESCYSFDGIFTNTQSIIIHNDTLMFLENKGIENVHFKAVDLKTNKVFKSTAFENGYSLGYAAYDTLNNDYVFPIQLHSLVRQNLTGETRILKLKETCKIRPLLYKSLIFLQDRGCCIKVVSADSFEIKWTYSNPDDFTISQPILENKNVIFMLANNTLISCDFVTGKENWRYKSNTELQIGSIYGSDENRVFIINSDLKDNIEMEAIDIYNGKLLTRKKIKEAIDVWNISNVIIGDKIYCKGYDKIFEYSLGAFEKINEFKFNGLLNTKLIKFKNKILFSIDNDSRLFYIDNEKLKEFQSKIDVQDIIVNSNTIYLFSYPQLYKVKSEFK